MSLWYVGVPQYPMKGILITLFVSYLSHLFIHNARLVGEASFGPAYGAAQVIPVSINVEEHVYERGVASGGYFSRLIRKKTTAANSRLPSFRAIAIFAFLFLVLSCARAQFGKGRVAGFRNLAVGGTGVCSSEETGFSDATEQNTILVLEQNIRTLLLSPPVVSEQLHVRLTVLENGYLALLSALDVPVRETPFVNLIAANTLSYHLRSHATILKWFALHCESEELGSEVHIKTMLVLQKNCEEAVRSLVLHFPQRGSYQRRRRHAALLNTYEQTLGYVLHLGKLQDAAAVLLYGNLPFEALREAEQLLSTSGDDVAARTVRAGILKVFEELHQLVLKYEAAGLVLLAIKEGIKFLVQEMVVLASVDCLRTESFVKVAYTAVGIIRTDLRVLINQIPLGESASSIREIHHGLTNTLRLLEMSSPPLKVSVSTLRSIRRHFVLALSSVCYLLCSVNNAMHDSKLPVETRVEPSDCIQALINSISHTTYLRAQFLDAACLALQREAERLRSDASLLHSFSSFTISAREGNPVTGHSETERGFPVIQPFGARLALMIQMEQQHQTGQAQQTSVTEQWKRRALASGNELSRQSSVVMNDHLRIQRESLRCATDREEGSELAAVWDFQRQILSNVVAEAVLSRLTHVGEALTDSIHRSLGNGGEMKGTNAGTFLPTDPTGKERSLDDIRVWEQRDDMLNSLKLLRPPPQLVPKPGNFLGGVRTQPGDVRLPLVANLSDTKALSEVVPVSMPSNVADAFTQHGIFPCALSKPRVYLAWPGSRGETPSPFAGIFTSDSSTLLEESKRIWPRRPLFPIYGSVFIQLHPDLVASLISGIAMSRKAPPPSLPSGPIIDETAYPYTTPVLMYNANSEESSR